MRVTVVDFPAQYGKKEENLRQMDQVLRALKGKSDLIVFPEMALTGYENEPDKLWSEKMQVRLAEPVPGESTCLISRYCRETGLHAVVGMPERRSEGIYNAAVFFAPDGSMWTYEKMHLPGQEPEWARPGETPLIVPTPWGPIAVAICYDVYKFPEMARQARWCGARLLLNPTACAAPIPPAIIQTQTAFAAASEGLVVASANLTGPGLTMDFFGGSHVLAPQPGGGVRLLAGKGFEAGGTGTLTWYTAEIPTEVPQGVPFQPIRSATAWNTLLEDSRWNAAFRPSSVSPEQAFDAGYAHDIDEARRQKSALTLLILSEEEATLAPLIAHARETGKCFAAELPEEQLRFIGPSGIDAGTGWMAVETPWGLAGIVSGKSMRTQFEEYRALCAMGARMLMVPGAGKDLMTKLAERTACITAEVPVLGSRIWQPFEGQGGGCRDAGRSAVVKLGSQSRDRRLHVFRRNPLTGWPDLRPECYAAFWDVPKR